MSLQLVTENIFIKTLLLIVSIFFPPNVAYQVQLPADGRHVQKTDEWGDAGWEKFGHYKLSI
jgi:hypothetical protein